MDPLNHQWNGSPPSDHHMAGYHRSHHGHRHHPYHHPHGSIAHYHRGPVKEKVISSQGDGGDLKTRADRTQHSAMESITGRYINFSSVAVAAGVRHSWTPSIKLAPLDSGVNGTTLESLKDRYTEFRVKKIALHMQMIAPHWDSSNSANCFRNFWIAKWNRQAPINTALQNGWQCSDIAGAVNRSIEWEMVGREWATGSFTNGFRPQNPQQNTELDFAMMWPSIFFGPSTGDQPKFMHTSWMDIEGIDKFSCYPFVFSVEATQPITTNAFFRAAFTWELECRGYGDYLDSIAGNKALTTGVAIKSYGLFDEEGGEDPPLVGDDECDDLPCHNYECDPCIVD